MKTKKVLIEVTVDENQQGDLGLRFAHEVSHGEFIHRDYDYEIIEQPAGDAGAVPDGEAIQQIIMRYCSDKLSMEDCRSMGLEILAASPQQVAPIAPQAVDNSEVAPGPLRWRSRDETLQVAPSGQDKGLADAYTAELDKVSQRNYELRMELATLRARNAELEKAAARWRLIMTAEPNGQRRLGGGHVLAKSMQCSDGSGDTLFNFVAFRDKPTIEAEIDEAIAPASEASPPSDQVAHRRCWNCGAMCDQSGGALCRDVHTSLSDQDSYHFKNFHRLLCERFGYTHDEQHWRRDQLSLIEWIAEKIAPVERQSDQVAGDKS